MPSIFLSHTSYDKPFVEKLAHELKKVGVKVWFDKWEIKVGESLTWKIEEGIRENEFLGIVLSPEALASEWVRSELGAAWSKQMTNRKVVVLPILYRNCDIPLFLADRKYADFRSDFHNGFISIADVLGVTALETLSVDNWRRFVRVKSADWKSYRTREFENLVTVLIDRVKEYKWSRWVGGKNHPFSMTLYAFINRDLQKSVSLKLQGHSNAYMASLKSVISPKELRAADYDIYVGNTINECEEFVWRHMEDFYRKSGKSPTDSHYYVFRHKNTQEIIEMTQQMLKELSWYKGNDHSLKLS